jgi:hypothetical protein
MHNDRNLNTELKSHLHPFGSGFELREEITKVCDNDRCKGSEEACMQSEGATMTKTQKEKIPTEM